MNTLSSWQFFESVSARTRAHRCPEEVTFELTYGCNLRCVHCYNPTHRALPHELSAVEVLRILDQLANFGVLAVTFTGGEPCIRPDVGEILRYARLRGFIIYLLTNATRVTRSFAALLKEVGVDQVNVSIYGATEATYEQMTGVPGSYRKFRQGLAHLIAEALPVTVRMPVTTINHHELDASKLLITQMGQKFQYCLDIFPMVTGNLTPLQYRLAPESKVKIGNGLPTGASRLQPELSCSPKGRFIECACGQNRFAITPYGEMNLCTAFPIPRYNLRTGTLKEGWELLKQTVDEARPTHRYECPTCDVRPYCRQGRSDAWLETGDMSTCLPHYREWANLEHRTHALLNPRRPA
jgi:radical SAM protein with 4Fe4S-binding SPASM domain